MIFRAVWYLFDNFFVKYSPVAARNVSSILTHRLSDHQLFFLVFNPMLVKSFLPKTIETKG